MRWNDQSVEDGTGMRRNASLLVMTCCRVMIQGGDEEEEPVCRGITQGRGGMTSLPRNDPGMRSDRSADE